MLKNYAKHYSSTWIQILYFFRCVKCHSAINNATYTTIQKFCISKILTFIFIFIKDFIINILFITFYKITIIICYK